MHLDDLDRIPLLWGLIISEGIIRFYDYNSLIERMHGELPALFTDYNKRSGVVEVDRIGSAERGGAANR